MAKFTTLMGFVCITLVYGLPTGDKALEPGAATVSSLQVITSYTTSIIPIQTAPATAEPGTTGTIITELPTSGHASTVPFNTEVPSVTSILATAETNLSPVIPYPTAATSENIFATPIANNAPPPQIQSRSDHPVQRLGITDQADPVGTNKFYANFFLGGQHQGAWTHPYSVSWSSGDGNAKSWGLAATHTERNQLAYSSEGSPVNYFVGPIGIQSVILSAAELGTSTSLTIDTLEAFSANVNLAPSKGAEPVISFPLVQGMAFVTGLYTGATPYIQSGVFFRILKYTGPLGSGVTFKYQITLQDNTNWLLYVTPAGTLGDPPFTLMGGTTIQGPKNFHGTIQVAKNPDSQDGEAIYDASAGTYATGASISGHAEGTSGSYTLEWKKRGWENQTLLMFALPHHIESFDGATAEAVTGIQLMTTTKGMATAVHADRITMIEGNLPTDMGFGPWSPKTVGQSKAVSQRAVAAISSAGAVELGQDMVKQTNLSSMYYSGKGLAKFASVLYVVNDLANNSTLAAAGLKKLEAAFATFIDNNQVFPLVYDTVWKGIVSSATYVSGDTGVDFGNSLYNDHHFHYSYFVYAAAVIGYLDPDWLKQSSNKAWVDMLVRDFANPSTDDSYFPFSRSFDWYHGHSWAKGLFESGDGKDEESSSEDAFSSYAIKMWGKATGNPNMEARGNLQLAVHARSLQNYFLLDSANTVQPSNFIGNKVTGILFENKVDHTTYFGGNLEYVQGIHMLPLNPSSAYTRTATFVKEEWDTYFSNGRADEVVGGWKGVLYANLAIVDPVSSYNFFADPNFDYGSLDGGASRTWYLAYAAGLGGA